MITLLTLLLCALWSILLIDFFSPFHQLKEHIGLGITRKLVSDIAVIDYILYFIHVVISCPSCFSCYLFFFSYLIITGSLFGFFLIPAQYFITFLIKEYILVIRL